MDTRDEKPLVLVTGASGYIASHIVKQLLESEKYQAREKYSVVPQEYTKVCVKQNFQCS